MQELIDKIYLVMGVDEEILPLDVVTYYLEEWLIVYPDNECLALYNTVTSLYEYLIKNAAANDASGLNSIKREKEGNVEVEMQARKSGDNTSLWVEALERFEENPALVFPSCRDQFKSTNTQGRVIVGGVDRNKIRDIVTNKDIRTGGASEVTGVRWGSRSSFYRRGYGRRSSFRFP